jgi:hypothetical protein
VDTGDVRRAIEVGDGARDLEEAMIGARGKRELFGGFRDEGADAGGGFGRAFEERRNGPEMRAK